MRQSLGTGCCSDPQVRALSADLTFEPSKDISLFGSKVKYAAKETERAKRSQTCYATAATSTLQSSCQYVLFQCVPGDSLGLTGVQHTVHCREEGAPPSIEM